MTLEQDGWTNTSRAPAGAKPLRLINLIWLRGEAAIADLPLKQIHVNQRESRHCYQIFISPFQLC